MANGFIGNALDAIGTALNLPELGWSEGFAGGATANTGTKQVTNTGGLFNTGASTGAPIANDAYNSAVQNLMNNIDKSNPSTQTSINTNAPAQTLAQQQAAQVAAQQSALRQGFNNQKSNIYGSSLDAANSKSGLYNQNVLDTIRNLTQSQQAIDRQNVENEASKLQGSRDINDMVGRGVRSGGTLLANRNAGSSSAAQAIANAYSQLGQRELSKVGNQYAANQGNIALTQDNLNYDIAQAPERFRLQTEQDVDSIVSSARDQLSALDAAMANASLPDRIAIDQERQSIKDQVLGVLGKYSGQLQQGVQGIKGASFDDIRGKANAQLSAGQAPAESFSYTAQTPAQLQGTGPFASELPIFTYSRRNEA